MTDKKPGLDGLLKGTPMPAAQQWQALAMSFAIRDILIANHMVTMEGFNAMTNRKLELINEKRNEKLKQTKKRRYNFGKK